ncbi:DUF6266 family protein [Pedobacter ginsengisoli]|uniref:DUF6266 family protein n=1 Tax=Pedobacter ginsengisoli TaxID=363852 RepID=UPI00254AC6E4|nr:DUF6266 family protein [Pedobacter ginsengisoli]
MGKLTSGPFGPMQGTTGRITAYMLNGQNVTRINPDHPIKLKRNSKGQLANQQELKVVNKFLDSLSPLLKVGFSIAAKNTTKNFYNLALSYNKKYALKGEYPDIEMDYPNVRISEGGLPPALNPIVQVVPEGLKFSWDQATGYDQNRASDQVMLLAYAPGSERVRAIRYGAERSEGFETLHITDDMLSEPLETYISFINDERTAVATSIYTGRIGG